MSISVSRFKPEDTKQTQSLTGDNELVYCVTEDFSTEDEQTSERVETCTWVQERKDDYPELGSDYDPDLLFP
jgi:hypothetical protein